MRRGITAGYYEGNTIPKPTKWTYSVSALFRDACYTLVSAFLTNYIMYSGVLSTNAEEYKAQMGVINILFVIFLIWDGINDPLFGFILEKCHLKTGKFRPWIAIGGILNSIMVALMFCVRPKGWAFVVFWAIIYFLWDAVFTLNDIAYWAMLPAMTSDEKQRNRITTIMGIFVSIGQFAMYGVCSLLPNAKNYPYIYTYIAIPTVILFCLSQLSIFFICQEKKRDPLQEEISSETSFLDMFRVLKVNKPLRTSIWGLFFYQVGSGLLIGTAAVYFYFVYGYGGDYGGTVSLMLTVCYGLGTVGAQFLFPLLTKHLKKQTLLTITRIIAVTGYCILFLVSVPLFSDYPLAYNHAEGATSFAFALGGTMVIMYIPALLFFAAQGVYYLTLLVMIQNTIEYNEWKNGERKESVIFSWRPLCVKLGSAVQKIVSYVTLLTSGLYDISSKISSAEEDMAEQINAGVSTEIAEANCQNTINAIIGDIEKWQKIVLGACMIGSIIICLVASWVIVHFGYKIEEEEYQKIVLELEERHKKDAEEFAKTHPESVETPASL